MTATTTTATAAFEPDRSRIRLRSPSDLVAVLPYLLGFHPTDSVAVLAFREPASGTDKLGREPASGTDEHGREPASGTGRPGREPTSGTDEHGRGGSMMGAARLDLPEPADAETVAHALVDPMVGRGATAVAVLGYGTADRADPVVPVVRATAERAGLRVTEALRVDAGRWWSYTCENPECCPPEGTPFDAATSEVAAQCAFQGLAALPSRGDLERRVAPVGGLARTSMTQATDRADAAFLEWLEAVPELERADALVAEGTAVVQAAIARYAEGGTLDDDEVARLTIFLTSIQVRDVAWRAISTEQPHLSLWTDVVRRADPSLAVAPASLLAFTAWCHGNGVLAGLALERALREDPTYTMAQLLLHGLQHGPPPPDFQDWGTPEWERRLDRDLRRPRQPATRSRKPRRKQRSHRRK